MKVKRLGPQCARRLLVIEDESTTTFEVYVTPCEHDHDQIANKINDRLRDRIIKLYESNSGFPRQKFRIY